MLDFFKKIFSRKPKKDPTQIDYDELYSILASRLFASIDRKYREQDKINWTNEAVAFGVSYYWDSVKHLPYANKLLDLAFTIRDGIQRKAMWLQVKGTIWEQPFTVRTLGQKS